MNIHRLTIKNFRNIENIDIYLNPNINIFIGDNAQGKTNILESIYVLGLTKSHNNNIGEGDLIKYNSLFAKISSEVKINNSKKKFEVVINKLSKTLKINNIEENKISNYISNLNIIIFAPDDLDIIKKSPNVRRNLINIQLCQLNKDYLITLNQYNKLLKMRNEYLKRKIENIDFNYLDILTDKLIDKALIILNIRYDFIEKLNLKISKIFNKITGFNGLKIIYNNSYNITNFDKELLRKKYKDNFNNEYSNKTTLLGPHRDDFSFFIENYDLKRFGSQGQQRLAILSLKLAEIDIFKLYKGTYPIVLFDDVFSEIDIKKQNKLLDFIKSNVQYVITTTDIENIDKKLLNDSSVFYVKQGKIVERK